MLPIIGALIVFGCVIGGYMMHNGNLAILWQPSELLIIGGAAVGALVIQSPPKILANVLKNMIRVVTAKGRTKKEYLEILGALHTIFAKMRKEGLIAIENDIENYKDA